MSGVDAGPSGPASARPAWNGAATARPGSARPSGVASICTLAPCAPRTIVSAPPSLRSVLCWLSSSLLLGCDRRRPRFTGPPRSGLGALDRIHAIRRGVAPESRVYIGEVTTARQRTRRAVAYVTVVLAACSSPHAPIGCPASARQPPHIGTEPRRTRKSLSAPKTSFAQDTKFFTDVTEADPALVTYEQKQGNVALQALLPTARPSAPCSNAAEASMKPWSPRPRERGAPSRRRAFRCR